MIFSGANFPHQVIEAIENEKLVFFCGAGVSMGPPANLPNFEQLATYLAAGTGKTIEKPLDRFIGTLPLDPQALRHRAASKISEASLHNLLHKDLLRVFVNRKRAKIVTTNFDTLFESASMELWDEPPTVFTAPALPLGSDVHGIIHLHGAIELTKNIVLTDSDFGRAYLTEGWARRFLVDLFEHYTVLFVGYAHDDTVLQYLARALPDKAKGKRYSLVGSTDEPLKWSVLGIEPVVFTQSSEDDFSTLSEVVREFADFSNRRPSDWKAVIGAIAKNPPSAMDASDQEVIRHALKVTEKLRYFCTAARSFEWLDWLDAEKAINNLFNQDRLDERGELIVNWIIENIVVQEPDQIVYLIAKHGFALETGFWMSLCHKATEVEEPIIFSKLTDVLLQAKPANVDGSDLHFLAEKSCELGLFTQSLNIFEEMASSSIVTRPPLSYQTGKSSYKVNGEININCPEWNLNEVWEKCLKPSIDEHYRLVLETCVMLLMQRTRLHGNWIGVYENFDRDSAGRSGIAEHPQDEYREPLDVIIDAARDSIEKFAENTPVLAVAWGIQMLDSASHLLQRVAVHAINFMTLIPDEKSRVLLEFGLLNNRWRRESFYFIEQNYASLNNASRRDMISTVRNFGNNGESTDLESAHEHIQWLKSMLKADNACSLANTAIETIEGVYGEISSDPYAGLTSWHESGYVLDESPWSIDRLLNEASIDWFDKIYLYENDERIGKTSRLGLLRALGDAAKQDRTWLFKFYKYLVQKELWESDIWPFLLSALEQWPSNRDDADDFLKLLDNKMLYSRFSRELANILAGCVRHGGVPYMREILENTNAIALSIWESIEPSERQTEPDQVDWMFQAINTTEGTLAEYWILTLAVLNPKGERELEEPNRTMLSRLCRIDDVKTAYTIPIVTKELKFLTFLDQQWSIDTIYPLFESTDDEVFTQAWHGFLFSTGVSESVFNLLKRGFEKAVFRIDLFGPTAIHRFIGFYANVAVWILDAPQEDWIPVFFGDLPEKHRHIFAQKIYSILRGIKSEKIDEVWASWLSQYWQNRIDKSPVELNSEEIKLMLEWLPYVENQFDAAVALAIQMEKPSLDNCSFIRQIGSKHYAKRFPNAVAKLIIYLLSCDQKSWSLRGLEEVIGQLTLDELDSGLKDELTQSLIASGRGYLRGS